MDQKIGSVINNETIGELGFLYERLLSNLDRELSVQQSLLQLLEEERMALTRASAEAIQETNVRKEALLLKGKENGAVRQQIIDQVRTLPGWDEESLTLSSLANRASDKVMAAGLRKRQQALTDLMTTIRMHNNRNIELINAAINDVQGALHLIQSMVSPSANYEKSGQFGANTIQGTLIHREG